MPTKKPPSSVTHLRRDEIVTDTNKIVKLIEQCMGYKRFIFIGLADEEAVFGSEVEAMYTKDISGGALIKTLLELSMQEILDPEEGLSLRGEE